MRRVIATVLLLALLAAWHARTTHASPAAPPQTPSAPAPPAQAAAAPSAAGRWEGKLDVPNQPLDVVVDLVAKDGALGGVITIPAQNLEAFPLTGVTAKGASVTFGMAVPGNPTFTGTIDATGKTMTGNFTQGPVTLTFSFTRTGDAKIEPAPPSTAIPKELEGTWEGAIPAPTETLRLVLTLSTGPDGLGKGTLVSVDQGGVEIPVQTVSVSGGKLTLLLPTIAGAWEGALKGAELEGTWKQGPGTTPLTFKRAAAAK